MLVVDEVVVLVVVIVNRVVEVVVVVLGCVVEVLVVVLDVVLVVVVVGGAVVVVVLVGSVVVDVLVDVVVTPTHGSGSHAPGPMSVPPLLSQAILVFTTHLLVEARQHWVLLVSTVLASAGLQGVSPVQLHVPALQAARTALVQSPFALPVSPVHWVAIARSQLLRPHGLAAPTGAAMRPTARRSPSTANVPRRFMSPPNWCWRT